MPYFLGGIANDGEGNFADKVLHYIWLLTSKEVGCRGRLVCLSTERRRHGQCFLEFDMHAPAAAAWGKKNGLPVIMDNHEDAFALACFVIMQCNLLNFCPGKEEVVCCSSKEDCYLRVCRDDASFFFSRATKSAKRMEAALQTRQLLNDEQQLLRLQWPVVYMSFVYFCDHHQDSSSISSSSSGFLSSNRVNLQIPTSRLLSECVPAFLDGLDRSLAKRTEEELLVALCMGLHGRLGKDSWLRVLSEDVLYTIARVYLIPCASSKLISRENMEMILKLQP